MHRPAYLSLAALSLVTAAIHASVVREHLHEYLPFGVFFAALTIIELAVAVTLVGAPTGRLLAVVAAENIVVGLLWALSRTVGLPVGPERWTAEAVQTKDAVCTATECVLILLSVLVLRSSTFGCRGRTRSEAAGTVDSHHRRRAELSCSPF